MMRVSVWLVFGLVLHACDSGDAGKEKAGCGADAACVEAGVDGGQAKDAGQVDSGPQLNMQGRVFDAQAASAIAGVSLAIAGESTSSDKDGAFSLSRPAQEKTSLLEVSNDGYVPAKRVAPEQGGYLEVFLKQVDQRISFRGDEGVSVRLPSGAGIDIPAGAVEDRQGGRIDGLVTLELAEIDGRVRTQAAALPGDGHARTLDQRLGLASVERALSIRILDDKESELTVNQAADVRALMPAVRADAAAEERVYSFDEAKGEWVEEGVAPRLTRDGVRAYHVDIEHLSWWAVGRFFEAATCIRACVEDGSGTKVEGAQVWIVGASHAGVSSFFTDASGCGASDVVADARVVLVAQYLSAVSDASKVETGSAAASVRNDAAACGDGGTLVLKTAPANPCPSGFSACGNACVDLASDARHCGTCGNACAAEQICALDSCEAPAANKIAVRGRVADRYGNPWSGVTVQVGSVTQVTDATGGFAFDDVSLPYDLKVARGNPKLYLGLTRADPEIRETILGGNSASLRGVVSGGTAGFPLPADHELHVTFVGPVSINFNATRNAGQSGSWGPSSPQWSAAKPSITGTLFATQHNDLTNVLTGIGSKVLTLTNGEARMSPELDIVLSSVTPHSVDFNVSMPAGMTFTSYDLGIGMFFRQLSSPPSTSFTLDVPDELPDTVPARLITKAALGTSSVQYVHYFGAATRTLNVQMALPVAPLSPAAGAAGTPQTRFEFTPQAEAITLLQLGWNENADNLSVQVYTHDTAVALERLRALGVTPVPEDGALNWSLVGEGPAVDIDELLDPARPAQAPTSISSYAPGGTLTYTP